MNKPFWDFTVLIPVYKNDKAEQLLECFESIKNQTLTANQVLILVDGPVGDDLREIVKKSSYEYVFFDQNRGLPFVLNEGLKLSRNEIIFRMDADDIASTNRFEKQINFLQNNPDIVLVGGQVQEFIQNRNNIAKHRLVPTNHEGIVRFSKWRNPFNHPTVAFRKSVINKLQGYNSEAKYFEDYELWIRVLAAGYKTSNLPEVLCYMRTNQEFVKRRSGIKYLGYELYLLNTMLKSNYIGTLEFLILVLVRLPIRLLPIPLLKIVYNKLLRNNS